MDNLIGLFGREELVGDLVAEIKKGKHVILTGPVGIGKSAVLREALKCAPIDLLIKLDDYQAKGQFIEIAKQMLELGLLSAKELGLPVKFHNLPVADIDWKEVKNQINRMSMRDLTHAIIPALARADTKPVIAVDDLTSLTPTQMAFWLAIFDHAQVGRLRF
jgi:ABC-type cobalamin/Fe3+-siderophores transport system ATPase subunit